MVSTLTLLIISLTYLEQTNCQKFTPSNLKNIHLLAAKRLSTLVLTRRQIQIRQEASSNQHTASPSNHNEPQAAVGEETQTERQKGANHGSRI